jgi:hypothetical protein
MGPRTMTDVDFSGLTDTQVLNALHVCAARKALKLWPVLVQREQARSPNLLQPRALVTIADLERYLLGRIAERLGVADRLRGAMEASNV